MPVMLMVRGAKDLLFVRACPANPSKPMSSTSTAASLYEIFFEPYTKKFSSTLPRSCIATGRAPASTAP